MIIRALCYIFGKLTYYFVIYFKGIYIIYNELIHKAFISPNTNFYVFTM